MKSNVYVNSTFVRNTDILSSIKKLASQTLWYGVSNVLARMLNFLLTPILTYLLGSQKGMVEFGDFSLLYAWVAVVNILFSYGLETGYFRFSNKENFKQKQLFNTTLGSHIISTVIFSIVIIALRHPVSELLQIGEYPEIITMLVLVIAFDTLSIIPFAKLRQENKPRKYAAIKVLGVLINILLVIFFVYVLPTYFKNATSGLIQWVLQQNRVSLLVLANLVQALFTFTLLYSEWKSFRFSFDKTLWKQILKYSTPMIIIGLAGMINEVMDRQMLLSYLPYSIERNKQLVGIYSANYKISIFITLFIQAFRLAAEPFFFKQQSAGDAKATYAKVMKWFVITLCLAFLFTGLYLHIWQYMIGPEYREGLYIVPILLMANVFLGIYYNLSIWYKVTEKMYWGIIITVIGAIITLVGNYIFIPKYEMLAGATVTMICYGSMVALAYLIGQRYYAIPYALKTIGAYILFMLLVFILNQYISTYINNFWIKNLIATFFMFVFILVVVISEKKEFQQLPLIGKYLK